MMYGQVNDLWRHELHQCCLAHASTTGFLDKIARITMKHEMAWALPVIQDFPQDTSADTSSSLQEFDCNLLTAVELCDGAGFVQIMMHHISCLAVGHAVKKQ